MTNRAGGPSPSLRRFPMMVPAAIAIALVAAHAVLPAAAAGKGVRLRYGLKPATTYDQEASIALDLKIDPGTLPHALAGMVRSMVPEMRQEVRLKGLLEMKPKAADGSIPFTFRIVEAKGSLVRGNDVKALSGISTIVDRPPVAARISADGRRVEMPPATDAGQEASGRARDQLAQSLPELPEADLQVGESFEALVPVRLPGAGGRDENRVEARWVYTLRAVKSGQARFDVKQTLPETGETTLSGGRAYSTSGGASGTATFDLKEGLFTAMDLDADMGMTVSMPMPPGLAGPAGAGPGDAPGAAGTPAEGAAATQLTVGSKVTGPMRMSMGRAISP